MEVAGGLHSLYLDISKRKELAKIVCNALMVIKRRGHPFELTSQTRLRGFKQIDSMSLSSIQSSTEDADLIFHRKGKLCRFGAKISNLQVIVTFFTLNTTPSSILNEESSDANDASIVINIYSSVRSLSCELIVTSDQQIQRLGKTIVSYKEGHVRATSLRHLCRFIQLDLIHASADSETQQLTAKLISPEKEFLAHYENVGVATPGEELNVIGAPVAFLPLNTLGDLFHRRVVRLPCDSAQLLHQDCMISLYTKSIALTPDRGVVMKLYESESRHTTTLHVGPIQLQRSCEAANEIDLLHDLASACLHAADYKTLDPVEQAVVALTTRGDDISRMERIMYRFADVLLADIRLRLGVLEVLVPYFVSAPKPI
jgi:hypothetical protein